jgi:hypothetical protein
MSRSWTHSDSGASTSTVVEESRVVRAEVDLGVVPGETGGPGAVGEEGMACDWETPLECSLSESDRRLIKLRVNKDPDHIGSPDHIGPPDHTCPPGLAHSFTADNHHVELARYLALAPPPD